MAGDFLNDDEQTGKFMTINLPNGGIDEVKSSAYCFNQPAQGLPCTSSANGQVAARSRHTGGVNVVLCDGSVQFIRNSIDLQVWQGMSTMNGGEIVSPN